MILLFTVHCSLIKLIPLIQPPSINFRPVWLCVVGVFLAALLFISPVAAAEIVQNNSSTAIIDRIEDNNVIYLGENHDRIDHHRQQLKIITQLYQHQASQLKLAIALEMFQRPFQPVLNRYLAGEIDEERLKEQTEYETRWGFDWEFYAPILRFARANQIPLIALNTPAEITFKVAESGLNSLQGSDFRYIPPLTDIDLDNQIYRQRIEQIYYQHVENDLGNSQDADNFFAAQILWDETMAEAIANYYQNHPESQIVVLVGKAHVMHDYAIPDRVARRIADFCFTQESLLLGRDE